MAAPISLQFLVTWYFIFLAHDRVQAVFASFREFGGLCSRRESNPIIEATKLNLRLRLLLVMGEPYQPHLGPKAIVSGTLIHVPITWQSRASAAYLPCTSAGNITDQDLHLT